MAGINQAWELFTYNKSQICDSGLWLIQHLKAAPISPSQQELIAAAIERSCCAAIRA